MNNIKPEYIKLTFILDNQQKTVIKCHIKERLYYMFEVYCKIEKINLDSVYLLYNGNIIVNLDLTIDEIANKISKRDNEVIILVCHRPNSVLMVFKHLNDIYTQEIDIENNIDLIFSNYLSEKKIDRNSVILRYNNQIFDLDQTINQFITKNKINLSNINMLGENSVNNLIKIKLEVIDIHQVNKIIFTHNKEQNEGYYDLDKNMGDIFENYLSKRKMDKNKVEFKYKGQLINKKQLLSEFMERNNIKKNGEFYIYNQSFASEMNKIKNSDNMIYIDVIELSYILYFIIKYKKALALIFIIIIVSCLTVLIMKLISAGSYKKNEAPPSVQIIPDDYFIKAEYFSEQFETVKLISDKYDLNKIKNMSIDGNIIKPTKEFTFNKIGYHNVYYSFNPLNDASLLSEGRYIFNDITNLIGIEISNYSESYPDVSFHGMFNNCINLQEADFSKMKLNYDYYYNYYTPEVFEYYNSMDYMFNNCTNLNYIDLDFQKSDNKSKINIISSKFMFNNCTSLININLSKINFHKNLNNMFSNCISLKTIIFDEFKYIGDELNMSYIFYNCSSLVSLTFPSQNMNIPKDMSYSFAYCSSLINLELEFNNYYYSTDKNNMSNAFRNCSNLTSINLKYKLFFEDMSYSFMGCYSLEHIDIVNYFYFPFAKYMNNMFLDCKSLKGVDFISEGFYGNNLIDISYMLSGSSIAVADLSKLETKNIINYEGLFYNCENLYLVNISSFHHNNLPDSKLSIFKDNYYINTYLIINEEFLSRIQVPTNFNIILYNINR